MNKIGPFLCEWCNTELTGEAHLADMSDEKTPEGKRDLRAVGWCPKCGAQTWSGKVSVDANLIEVNND